MPYCPPPTPPIGMGPKAWESYRAECQRQQRHTVAAIWMYVVCCAGLAAIVLLAGCTIPPTPNTTLIEAPTNSRFTVERVGTFEDALAYDDKRGIYLIRDNETEQEYVGISGIGISEVGSHRVSSGKNGRTVEDER